MPKQLNVNLAFTADTSQAKAQIDQLQRQLSDLVNIATRSSGSNFAMTKEIQNATSAAIKLKAQLQSATDVDTGKLNLTKFVQSMTQSGMSLKKYEQQLSALGPAGEQAFSTLAASINNADARLKNSNTLLNQFATTLKNTARWQISSSLLHGFMGTLQSAYGYAQDLNQSLNNIRIVTGASVDEMASFAVQANKAAQALSTTTTAYTDAALIYYQQGIRDQEEIAGRTETTIKLANVSRQSAEETSDQLTAIWNNFYDGSKSLEYYADVITALGAATASSSEEISTGLQKFAAVADTVGLSYEYATSALATITATTRQSADTVGTGLRTLFTRLQGLKLGETLEDGVDLNKYSEALNTVGIQILDVNGEMKNMDTILDELGARWDGLSKAQQTALAQTIGGVRQYTNLIALMDNWDFMKENLTVAEGSEGTLQEQADIYAESWEAAQKRVRAAAEEIYSSLLDDKFFIQLNNGFAGFLNIVQDTIDGLGGLKGVLLLVGTVATKIFGQDLANSIAKMTSNFQLAMQGGQKYVEQQRQQANELLINKANLDGTTAGAATAQSYQAQGNLQQEYLRNAERLTSEQQIEAQLILDQNKALQEELRTQAEITKEIEAAANATKREVELTGQLNEEDAARISKQGQQEGRFAEADKSIYGAAQSINNGNIQGATNPEQFTQLGTVINNIKLSLEELDWESQKYFGEAGDAFTRMTECFDKDGNLIKDKLNDLKNAYADWSKAAGSNAGVTKNYDELVGSISRYSKEVYQKAKAELESGNASGKQKAALQKIVQEYEQADRAVKELYNDFFKLGQEETDLTNKNHQVATSAEEARQKLNAMAADTATRLGQGITAVTSSLMSFGMALSSIKSLGSIWADDDISIGEKIISTMTSLGLIVPSLTTAFSALNRQKILSTKLNLQELMSLLGVAQVEDANGVKKWAYIGIKEVENKVTEEGIVAKEADAVASGAEAAAEGVEAAAATTDTVAHGGLAKALWQAVAARLANLGAMLPYLAAMAAAVAAIALIIAAIKALVNWYNKDAIAAEKAAESAKQLGEVTKQTQEAAENLRSTIDGYDSCIEKLNACVKGTKEWKEAFRETRKESLKVLEEIEDFLSSEDYKKLLDYYKEHGTLDPEILDQAQEKADKAAMKAEYSTAYAEKEASDAAVGAEATGVAREMNSIGDGLNTNDIKDFILNNVGDLSAMTEDEFKEALRDFGIKVDDISDETLSKWKTSVDHMAEETDMAASKFGLFNEMELEDILPTGTSEGTKGYVAAQVADETEQIFTQLKTDWENSTKGHMENGEFIADHPEAIRDYHQEMEAVLKENGLLTDTDSIEYNDEGVKITDSEGNTKQELNYDAILYMEAAGQALESVSEHGSEAGQVLAKMSAEGTNFAERTMQDSQAGAVDTSGYVSTLNQSDLTSLAAGDYASVGLNDADIQAIADAYNVPFETVVANLQENAANAKEELQHVADNLSPPVKAAYQEMLEGMEDITLEKAQSMADTLSKESQQETLLGLKNSDFKYEDYTGVQENGSEGLEAQVGLVNTFSAESGIDSEMLNGINQTIESGGTLDPEQINAVAEAYANLNSILSEEGIDAKLDSIADASEQLGEIDEDVDSEALEEMTEYISENADEIDGLSKSYKNNTAASKKLAHEWLRFDAAAESVTENFEEWHDALKTGTKDVPRLTKTMKQLKNTYGDMLDIDGSQLSEEFLSNAENLELMQEAANGSEEAYNELQAAAAKDILIHAGADTTEAEEAVSRLQDYTTSDAFEDIEIGAYIDDADAIQAMNELINAADMTATEAQNLLAGMGIDAEVEQVSVPESQKQAFVDAKPTVTTQPVTVPSIVAGEVSNTTVYVPSISYSGSSDVETSEGEKTATALRVTKAQKGSGGGGVKVNHSGGGGSSGGCFIAGTLISTINGFKSIENIQPGEIVLSYNEQNKQNEYSEVLQTMIHYLWTDVYTININNEKIRATGIHRFYIKRAGMAQWIPASELQEKDLMYLASGEWKQIDKIKHKKIFRKVYNFEVNGNHNYYVTESRILAHNKGGCFIAGTLITTDHGFENIEKIQPGDIVLSYNEMTKQNEYSKVLDTMIHKIWTELYSLYIENEIIKVTDIHRFYILRSGQVQWIPACEIRISDLVLFADGTWHQIDDIKKKRCFKTVYNFEVSNNHNYYVSKNQVLVHNKGCFIAHTLVTTNQGFKNIENIQVGDTVLSYNEQTKQNVYSKVAETMIHFVQEPIYTLYIENETLKVTGIHRFFIKRNEFISWIHAEDLQEGDFVLFANGTWHQIFKITKRFQFRKVYNFEVSNTHNYYVGDNQILAHNKGGGSGRTAERQTKSDYKTGRDAGERYHVIQQKLTSLSAAYDKVSAAADRAFGKDKIKLLNQQIKAQDKLIESQKEYVKQIKANIKTDTKNLSYAGKQTYYSEVDGKKKSVNVSAKEYLGMKLDIDPTTGALKNYDDLIKKANEKYNAKLDWYNKLSGKNQEKDSTKKAMEANEQQYQGFMDMLEQYEETIHLYEDATQELQDMKNEKYDLQLDKVDIEVNYKIDVQDDELKIVDLMLQKIEDDASKAVERINLIGKQASIAESKMNTYKQGIQAIFNAHDDVSSDEASAMMNQLMNGNAQDSISLLKSRGVKMTEKEVDQLRSYSDGLLEETQNLMDYRKQVVEEISNTMDDNIEKFDRLNNKMEKLKTVTNSYKNLVDLTGKKYLDISSDLYDQMEETNVQLAKQSLDNAKLQKEQAETQLEYLKKKYATVEGEISEAEKIEWDNRIKEAEDYVDEMTENFYSSWEEALEAVSTRFESAMTNMVADFSAAIAGMAGNLEGLQNQMDLKQTIEEVYVPDYEKIYQLTKLTRDAQKEIDSATNVKVKKELQGVQEKILALQQSGEKVSQYELDYLQKELELKKAQLALEEASEVKSQVRMSRDSEGNFSYVYTANQGAVEDAEAEYANKLYEMQKLNEEYINDMQSQIVVMEQDYASALQEAADIYGVGTTEYYNALMAIEENYSAFFDNLNSELNLAIQNQDETQTIHASLYTSLTGDTLQAAAQVTTQWEETTLATLTGFQTASEYQTQWKTASQEAYTTATEAAQTWEEDIATVYESAGTSTTKFGDDTSAKLKEVQDENAALSESFKTTASDAETSFEAAVNAVTNWEQQHSEKIQAAIESNKTLVESINEIIKAWEGASESIEAINDIQADSVTAPTSAAAPIATTAAKKTPFEKALEKKAASLAKAAVRGFRRRTRQQRKRYRAAYEAAYNKALKQLKRNVNKKAKNARSERAANRYFTRKVLRKSKRGLKRAARRAYRKRYDTGGYTGDWAGNGGKEAILHKKELVLNAKDTENMLKTVDMVRSIAAMINLNAISSSGGLSQLNAPGAPVTAGTLDQQVTITAEFPNATDRNEILSAFDNVINLASQYANR